MVRLGKFGEQEQHALETGELLTGWSVSDLSSAKTRTDILQILEPCYPTEKQGTLQNWAVQLNQFIHGITEGDLAIVPLKTSNQIAIGRFEGPYYGKADRPCRRVKWLRTDLPRTAVKQDLLYSLGATQTVCEISRNEAISRFESLAQKGIDPGPNAKGLPSFIASSADLVDEAEDAITDLEPIARDQIVKHISANFAGHSFTQLIAAILEAEGYTVRVSPPGSDKGVDIVAGQGALGFGSPRLVVQVKSGGIVADHPALQGLLGSIQDTHSDYGLLVSWSGFTGAVRQRTNDLYFRVRLWGREEILNALFSAYDRLPESFRADLPLKRIWSLVDDSEAS